jgi:helicase
VSRGLPSDMGVPATVADVADDRWGVRPEPASERFTVPGWWYEALTPLPCPHCSGELHVLRKLYDGPNRGPDDEPSYLIAVVCPACPRTFTLRDLGQRSYKALMGEVSVRRTQSRRAGGWRSSAIEKKSDRSSGSPWLDCDIPPGEMRSVTIPADRVHEYVAELLSAPGPAMFDGHRISPVREPEIVAETRLLHWRKIVDPAAPVSPPPAEVDVRVLLPLAPEFAELCVRLAAAGVPYRQVRYWLEAETVSTIGDRGELAPLRAVADLAVVTSPAKNRTATTTGPAAAAARDAFEMMWDTHLEPHDAGWEPVPAAGMVPEEWLPYLPHQTFNPAQVQAAPVVVDGNEHMVVTAPTGSGKTVIGMLAVLKAILGEERKAAWLVPQRSLTDELDRELATWRQLGLRVERLSGEYATDVEKVREADLWVATTEKFEAICRASSLRAALTEVSCLVVDEIHLLGDATRGPLLEALLARVRGEESPVRIVGLSATAANAGQVAGWLGARPVHTAWRPSRLTWQLPMVPASSDRKVKQETRTRIATEITATVTEDGGSVLVFCGSKRNVRATALAVAATRGANTRGVDVDDLARVHQICTAAGIGLHYKDWEFKHEAEQGFRNRTLDVLVATTTVAAGVNLPARAVVVRDTQIGLDKLNVATVQQMFGRAGRIGAGETEGWAYLVTDETERAGWQAQLVAGYSVLSHIAQALPDYVLAEAAQDRIHTIADAEHWWQSTLAYHQGTHDTKLVHDAIDYLVENGYLTRKTLAGEVAVLAVTDLGMLTTRFMVPVVVGTDLRTALIDEDIPTDPDRAESALGFAVATIVPQFAEAPVNEEVRPLVARLLRARGHLDRVDTTPQPPGLAPATACDPGDLARVAFALVANEPGQFSRPRRAIAGLPTTILTPILEEAPRYFHWLAAQGHIGAIHPWVAVVAADLGRRIRWRRLGPRRGSGRLLWICEQMATPLHADTEVPDLYRAARERDVANPDWPLGRPPKRCRLDDPDYLTLLRDRTTDTTFTDPDDRGDVTITVPTTATVAVWNIHTYHATPHATSGQFPYPGHDDSHPRGVTIFTRRGDYQSHGWLSIYNTIHD